MKKDWIEDQIDVALGQGKKSIAGEPLALSAQYSARTGRVTVKLANGCDFIFPARALQGFDDASDSQLATIEVSPAGRGLHWPALDADFTVAGLLNGLFGTRSWMARHAGRATSSAKAAAARANGRKGGRPRKPAV
jgi:hypothetical protein